MPCEAVAYTAQVQSIGPQTKSLLGRDPVHKSRTPDMYTWGLSLSIPSTNAAYSKVLVNKVNPY